jgi:hypothetical protein
MAMVMAMAMAATKDHSCKAVDRLFLTLLASLCRLVYLIILHYFVTSSISSSTVNGLACPDNSRGVGDLLPPYLLPIVSPSFKLPSMGNAQKFSYTNSD